MIPDHLVYRAAQAIWETGTTSEWRNDVWAAPYLTRARAALEAVAADIWDEATSAQADWEWLAERGREGNMPNPQYANPYRASETA